MKSNSLRVILEKVYKSLTNIILVIKSIDSEVVESVLCTAREEW